MASLDINDTNPAVLRTKLRDTSLTTMFLSAQKKYSLHGSSAQLPYAFVLNTTTRFPCAARSRASLHPKTDRTYKLAFSPRQSHHISLLRASVPTMSANSPEPNLPAGNIAEPMPTVGNGTPSGHRLEGEEGEEDLHDDYEGFLDNARIVSVPLPLDLYLAQSPGGKVYIDELVPDGNAAKVGGISVGDIVIAVSLPFGENLVPVPASDALDMVETHISSREEGEDFLMALVPGNIELLAAEEPEDGLENLTLEEMESNARKIYVREYPYIEGPEPVEEEELNLKSLREQGFDV